MITRILRWLIVASIAAGSTAAVAQFYEYRFVIDGCNQRGSSSACDPVRLDLYRDFFGGVELVLNSDGITNGAYTWVNDPLSRPPDEPIAHDSSGLHRFRFSYGADFLAEDCGDPFYCVMSASFLDDGSGSLAGSLLMDAGSSTIQLVGSHGLWTGFIATDYDPFTDGPNLQGRWLLVPEPGTTTLLTFGAVLAMLLMATFRRKPRMST